MASTFSVSTSVSLQARRSFRADIQGLRAVAVLMVLMYHSAPAIIPGGYVGVDIFFVISGFLITSHLLDELKANGTISLASFYARRAVRILPAALAVVALTTISALVWAPPLQHPDVFLWAAATALYVPNVLAAGVQTDYLAETLPSAFQQFWSLGVEEQFYLLWPAVLLFGWLAFRRSERALLFLVCILVLVSFIFCSMVMKDSQPQAFFSLFTRGWELGVGGLVAFARRSALNLPLVVHAHFLAWLGLLLLVFSALIYDTQTPFPGAYAVLPVAATALLITYCGSVSRNPGRLLSVRPLQLIGTISYSLYLVHWPLLVITQAAVGYNHPLPPWATILLAILALPVAYLLYRIVEVPFMRAGSLLQNQQPLRILMAAVATSVAVVIAAGAAISAVQKVRLDAGLEFPTSVLKPFPAATPYVPSNLLPALREGAKDLPLVMQNGCDNLFASINVSQCQVTTSKAAPLVALFGDSHASHWYPALRELAEGGHIRLESNTKGDCPSVDFPAQLEPNREARCSEWRDGVLDRFKVESPDIVLLANYAGNYLVSSDSRSVEGWTRGLANTIAELPDHSRVAVIADVPNMGESPAVCLSAHLHDVNSCTVPRAKALDSTIVATERAIAAASGASYLDLTEYLCGPTSCPPIIGNMLTHRDGDHLTATFGRALAQPFMQQLQPLLNQ